MLDIHCHILPGVDDGARTPEVTDQMLAAAHAIGIDKIVATPHVRDARTQIQTLDAAYTQVKPMAQRLGIQLHMGYEVNIAALSRMDMRWVERLCVWNTNCILIELPHTLLPPNWDILLSEISTSGFSPIIVHPERCVALQRSPDLMGEMRGYGCEFQVDGSGLLGSPFSPERKLCRYIIKRGFADYIASDAHAAAHYEGFRRALKWVGAKAPRDGRLNTLLDPA